MSPRLLYRIVAIAEAISWTLLIGGMIAKYGFNAGQLPVTIGGSIHGVVFISYLFSAVIVGTNQRWSNPRILLALVTAVIPYATIPFDRQLEKRSMLDGGWQREATANPYDQKLRSRLLRFMLKRPIIMAVGMIVAVAVVVCVLLVIGPPGGKH